MAGVNFAARYGYNVLSDTATALGNTTILTPTTGKRIRLHYLAYNANFSNAAGVTAALRFGAAGTLIYLFGLSAGGIFARNIGAGKNWIIGGVSEALIINLSAAPSVGVNWTIEYSQV